MFEQAEDKPIKNIHFIGIGGVGMSGIARVAHDQGFVVSGSDVRQSRYTDQLVEAGARERSGYFARGRADGSARQRNFNSNYESAEKNLAKETRDYGDT